MSEIEMVTVSSRGQVSIPAEVRRELGLEKGSKLLVVAEGENILLKKIDGSMLDKSLEEILQPMWDQAEDAGLSEEDAEELVHESRGVECG
jgi:antitoxin PrlF